MPSIVVGESVWVPSDNVKLVFEEGKVLTVTSSILTVKLLRGGIVTSVNTDHAFKINKSSHEDMTEMRYIHEFGILHNLEVRSYNNSPYTRIGPVLIAVNPLQPVPDPNNSLGKRHASRHAHPFGVAETAYQQMTFALSQRKRQEKLTGVETSEVTIDQSIVIGGESGSGKTESAKMVLKHLTTRSDVAVEKLDEILVNTNPVLESFGNASTSRNFNSSRFGKFTKLNYNDAHEICSATIETYLLERSRVTSHLPNERNFHVFYQMLISPLKKEKHLALSDQKSFRYLNYDRVTLNKDKDLKNHNELVACLDSMGFSAGRQMGVFELLAGILHLGNVHFVNSNAPGNTQGDMAVLDPKDKNSRAALDTVAKLFMLEPEQLLQLLTERRIQVRGQTITTVRNAESAMYSADAVAKALYSKLFDWLLVRINAKVLGKEGFASFIGILDIFGFESFEKNDFEQLLINFTNEALQQTFNKSVFEAEVDLLRTEGILTEGSLDAVQLPSNQACIQLLKGTDKLHPGVLALIDSVGKVPQATDTLLLNKLNGRFSRGPEKNEAYQMPHPSRRHEAFVVEHYAAKVTYTIGNFLEKNVDVLPKEVDECLSLSANMLLTEIWNNSEVVLDSTDKLLQRVHNIKRTAKSIISKFNQQVNMLTQVLDTTKVLFIRCIKANPQNLRVKGKNDWFLRPYIAQQLVSLSVNQTALVLKNGFPTRLSYATLYATYGGKSKQGALPPTLKEKRAFLSALFYSFNIDRSSYKLGLTKVFFENGVADQLDAALTDTSVDGRVIVKRFRYFYARNLWRRCLATVQAGNALLAILRQQRRKIELVVKTQATFRGYVGRKAGRRIREEARRAAEEARRAAEEARRAAEEAERLAAEQAAAAERAEMDEAQRLEAEQQEEERKRKYREQVEAAKAESQNQVDAAMNILSKAERKKNKYLSKKHKKSQVDDEQYEQPAADHDSDRENSRGNRSSTQMVKKLLHEKQASKRQLAVNKELQLMPRSEWDKPFCVWGVKQARISKRNWRRRFFVLDREGRTVAYYKQANPDGSGGLGRPKKVFSFAKSSASADAADHPSLYSLEDPVKKYPNVLKIVDKYSGSLLVSLGSEQEREAFRYALSQAVLGYEHSHLALKSGEPSKAHPEAPSGIKEVTSFAGKDVTDEAVQSIKALSKLRRLGLITAEECEKGQAAILQQMRLTSQGVDAAEKGDKTHLVMCPNKTCHMINNINETKKCVSCNTALPPRPESTETKFKYGDPLCELPYHAGLLRVWYVKHEMHYGFHPRVYYRFYFEFGSERTDTISWFIKLQYESLQLLRAKLQKSYTFPEELKKDVPVLSVDKHSTVADREPVVQAYVMQLFKELPTDALVFCKEVENLFSIQLQLHMREEDDAMTLHEEFYSDLSEQTASTDPLDRHDLDALEANVVAFRILIEQQGALSLKFDPRLHQIADSLKEIQPRIEASLDASNKLTHQDLMERASQLADDVKEVQRLYKDGQAMVAKAKASRQQNLLAY